MIRVKPLVALLAGLALLFVAQRVALRRVALPATVRIGCITTLTGDGASYGASTRRGVDLAAERINAAGGIGGSRVEVVYADDQLDPRAGVSAIHTLIGVERVPAIIGAFSSSVTLYIAPIAEKSRVVLLSASSTADGIRYAGEYVFRNVPADKVQGRTAAEYALARLGAKTASILRIHNDYGVSLGDAFGASFQRGGGRILSTTTYEPGTADFRGLLAKIGSEKPDLVFFPGHYQESGVILKQAKELGITAPFVGGDGSCSAELVRIAGAAAEGVSCTVMATRYGPGDPGGPAFVAAFEARYGQAPDVYAAYAYDALSMIAEAIRSGGYDAEAIKSALYAMRGFTGVTGKTEFDGDGEVDKPYGIQQVREGKFQPLAWKAER